MKFPKLIISTTPSVSIELSKEITMPKFTNLLFYILTAIAAIILVALIKSAPILTEEFITTFFQKHRISKIEDEIEQAWNNSFASLGDSDLPIIEDQSVFTLLGNVNTQEFDNMINDYNFDVENFVYDSDIISKLNNLQIKQDKIIEYINTHIFIDDGTLESKDLEFIKKIEESKELIEAEIKYAEEYYSNEIDKIIEKRNLKLIPDSDDTTIEESTQIFIPKANYTAKTITKNMVNYDYNPIINEINDEEADKIIADEINRRISQAFSETFSKLDSTPKNINSFQTVIDMTKEYEKDMFIFDQNVANMLNNHNDMVIDLANRGEDFPTASEMNQISNSVNRLKAYVNSRYVRVPNKDLDDEIDRQINIANVESAISQFAINTLNDEFTQKKESIFKEYGYILGNLPQIVDNDWQTVYNVIPNVNIIKDTQEIPFKRITFEETFNEEIITTKIKDDMADTNVFLSV